MTNKVTQRDGDVTTTIEFDEGENRFVVGHHQDIRSVIDHIADRDNDTTRGWSPSRNMRLKATIPEALYNSWLIEAQQQKIPIWNKRERDAWLRRKLAECSKLTVNGSVPKGRV